MKALALGLLLLCTGCSGFRVLQSKVPAPLLKAPEQVEAERAAADLIAREIQAPVELKPVAGKLSFSLGAPLKPFTMPTIAQNANAANAGLDKALVGMQLRLDVLNRRLADLQGKAIEGTGFSLLGPGMGLVVIGLIVLGVLFPPAFTILFFIFKRLRAAAQTVVSTLDEQQDPEVVAALATVKSQLSVKMDRAHKKVIHSLQKP